MSRILAGTDALQRLFAGLCEQTFQVELGIADPPLTDYLAKLLVRFVRMDTIFRIRNAIGQRLEQVGEMLLEAEERIAHPRREIHRHIGDFTLFWSGVYPEHLTQLKRHGSGDALIDYHEAGKRSYLIASSFEDDEYRDEAPVLKRLAQNFDLCCYGLHTARQIAGPAFGRTA